MFLECEILILVDRTFQNGVTENVGWLINVMVESEGLSFGSYLGSDNFDFN